MQGSGSTGLCGSQVELFCGNRHCKTNIVFQDSKDIDKITEFFQQVKRAREDQKSVNANGDPIYVTRTYPRAKLTATD